MNFNDQNRNCHAERSEASLGPARETLRCAQGDTTFPILLVNVHNRAATKNGIRMKFLKLIIMIGQDLAVSLAKWGIEREKG